jgi:hypothetical protein
MADKMARTTVRCICREAKGQAVVDFPSEEMSTTAVAREHENLPTKANNPSHGVVAMERGCHGLPSHRSSRGRFLETSISSKVL